jgi:CubicO group peptidase (beta-lactamase class C family)
VIYGILVEQATGKPLHDVYREYAFDPLGIDSTWLEGHEAPKKPDEAHHYQMTSIWTTISPTVDWAGGGLVTTAPDLARFVRGLWSERIVDADGLEDLTRWTPGAPIPPRHGLRYERYALGLGLNVLQAVGVARPYWFHRRLRVLASEYDVVLVGTHNGSHIDGWPLVGALCQEVGTAA